jgi:hypothetical protein
VKNWGGPYKEGSILWAYRQLREHAGCSLFPTQIHGNADAHLLILLHIATRLCITTVISDWLPVERQVIEHRYAAIMTLDNQLNSTALYPINPGFSIDCIHIKVPSLHGLLRWHKSIILDCVLQTVEGGAQRDALSASLLRVISPTQTWYNFLYAWMLREIISTESAWKDAPQFARQLRVLMYSFIAICRKRNHTPVRLVKLAVACQLLHPFMQSHTDTLFAPSGVTAVAGKHKEKNLTDSKTLFSAHAVRTSPCGTLGHPRSQRGTGI